MSARRSNRPVKAFGYDQKATQHKPGSSKHKTRPKRVPLWQSPYPDPRNKDNVD